MVLATILVVLSLTGVGILLLMVKNKAAKDKIDAKMKAQQIADDAKYRALRAERIAGRKNLEYPAQSVYAYPTAKPDYTLPKRTKEVERTEAAYVDSEPFTEYGVVETGSSGDFWGYNDDSNDRSSYSSDPTPSPTYEAPSSSNDSGSSSSSDYSSYSSDSSSSSSYDSGSSSSSDY
jgi:hypothetical protein